jgi:hypothetical protein
MNFNNTKKEKQKLIVFAYDANSANITIAYIYFYGSLYNSIDIYCDGPAKIIFEANHLSLIKNISTLHFLKTDTVVSGTSGLNSSYEMSMIKSAKIAGVKKTITLVDNIANFEKRFNLNGTLINEKYLADEIWLDTTIKSFQSIFPQINSRIIIKENFYDSYLKVYFEKFPPQPSHTFIKTHRGQYLLILTEYIYELYRLKFGFTEYEMVENILQAIDTSGIQIPIFLKLHPYESKNKFNILLRKYSHLQVLQDDCNPHDLIFFAKVVFGIHSSLFKECVIFKKTTFSIQINSNQTIAIENIHKENILYSKDSLIVILKKYFL